MDDNTSSPKPVRVLIADDDRSYGEVLDVTLATSGGIEVVGRACDGAEAVELALVTRPDAVVMDVNMPRMNGFDAAKAVLSALPSTCVLMNSAADHPENRARASEAGACGFLVKGCDFDGIVDALSSLGARARWVPAAA
jgi:DNA-binding NarL/FixJ family response regulator